MLCHGCSIEMPLVGVKGDPETGAGRQLSCETRLVRDGPDLVVQHVAKVSCRNSQCHQKGIEREVVTEVWRGGEADVV